MSIKYYFLLLCVFLVCVCVGVYLFITADSGNIFGRQFVS